MSKYPFEVSVSNRERDIFRLELALGVHDRNGGDHVWMNPTEVWENAWLRKDLGVGVALTEKIAIPYV